MREFSKISPSLWRSKRFQDLPNEKAKLTFLYLLTSDHQNSAGAFRLPAGYASTDLDWEVQDFETARGELVKAGLILFDAETDEYLITRWFKHNPPCNQKHRMGIVSSLSKLDSVEIQTAGMEALEEVSPSGDSGNLVKHPAADSHLLGTKFISGRR